MAITALATVRRLLPAAPVAIPDRVDGPPTAAGTCDELHADPPAVGPEGGGYEWVAAPATTGILALLDRAGAVPGRVDGIDRPGRRRGRPASGFIQSTDPPREGR